MSYQGVPRFSRKWVEEITSSSVRRQAYYRVPRRQKCHFGRECSARKVSSPLGVTIKSYDANVSAVLFSVVIPENAPLPGTAPWVIALLAPPRAGLGWSIHMVYEHRVDLIACLLLIRRYRDIFDGPYTQKRSMRGFYDCERRGGRISLGSAILE